MKDVYQVGYAFGKALCADDIDPLYYLEWIRLSELDLPLDQDKLLGHGAAQAIREMSSEIRVARAAALLQNRHKEGDDVEDDSPRALAFELGAQSMVAPAMYSVQSHQFEGWPDFERGVELGKKIRAAWESAISVP